MCVKVCVCIETLSQTSKQTNNSTTKKHHHHHHHQKTTHDIMTKGTHKTKYLIGGLLTISEGESMTIMLRSV